MMKNKYLILLILLIASCKTDDFESKSLLLVKKIINDPVCIENIRYEINISEIFKDNLKNYKNVYIKHFYSFEKKYYINKIIHGTFENNGVFISIYVVNYNKKMETEFIFRKQNNRLLLHNIVLNDCDISNYFFEK